MVKPLELASMSSKYMCTRKEIEEKFSDVEVKRFDNLIREYAHIDLETVVSSEISRNGVDRGKLNELDNILQLYESETLQKLLKQMPKEDGNNLVFRLGRNYDFTKNLEISNLLISITDIYNKNEININFLEIGRSFVFRLERLKELVEIYKKPEVITLIKENINFISQISKSIPPLYLLDSNPQIRTYEIPDSEHSRIENFIKILKSKKFQELKNFEGFNPDIILSLKTYIGHMNDYDKAIKLIDIYNSEEFKKIVLDNKQGLFSTSPDLTDAARKIKDAMYEPNGETLAKKLVEIYNTNKIVKIGHEHKLEFGDILKTIGAYFIATNNEEETKELVELYTSNQIRQIITALHSSSTNSFRNGELTDDTKSDFFYLIKNILLSTKSKKCLDEVLEAASKEIEHPNLLGRVIKLSKDISEKTKDKNCVSEFLTLFSSKEINAMKQNENYSKHLNKMCNQLSWCYKQTKSIEKVKELLGLYLQEDFIKLLKEHEDRSKITNYPNIIIEAIGCVVNVTGLETALKYQELVKKYPEHTAGLCTFISTEDGSAINKFLEYEKTNDKEFIKQLGILNYFVERSDHQYLISPYLDVITTLQEKVIEGPLKAETTQITCFDLFEYMRVNVLNEDKITKLCETMLENITYITQENPETIITQLILFNEVEDEHIGKIKSLYNYQKLKLCIAYDIARKNIDPNTRTNYLPEFYDGLQKTLDEDYEHLTDWCETIIDGLAKVAETGQSLSEVIGR